MLRMLTLLQGTKILTEQMMGRMVTLIISFEGAHIPREICCAGGIFRCRPHRPKAQYCHRCQQLMHRADVCTHKPRCPAFGQVLPEDASHTCSADSVCLRCGGPHLSHNATCSDRKAADVAVRSQHTTNVSLSVQLPCQLMQQPISMVPRMSRSRIHTKFAMSSRNSASSSARLPSNPSNDSPVDHRSSNHAAKVSQPLSHTPEHDRKSPALTYRDILHKQPPAPQVTEHRPPLHPT
ncbi:hypothetical protein HPB48_018116 [Haemaphysalis longicornis]|uniref:Uncharacterized protein n=1 Tax=Haemaphysalis longicornis TaxID=44386 RepID=A0A9J6GU18_HAELO|nr:hypothetical protein HPB48_018116 [Haemaphysalis longicornis]